MGICAPPPQDEDHLNSPTKREIARQEAERLKKQALQKKEALERMRMEQNRAGEAGEVRASVHQPARLLVPALGRSHSAAPDRLRQRRAGCTLQQRPLVDCRISSKCLDDSLSAFAAWRPLLLRPGPHCQNPEV